MDSTNRILVLRGDLHQELTPRESTNKNFCISVTSETYAVLRARAQQEGSSIGSLIGQMVDAETRRP